MPEAGDAVKVAPTIGAKAENNPPPKLVAWVLSRATNQNALATPSRDLNRGVNRQGRRVGRGDKGGHHPEEIYSNTPLLPRGTTPRQKNAGSFRFSNVL